MNDYLSILAEEEKELSKIIFQAEKFLKKAPEGKLRVQKSHNCYQFFQRIPSAKSHGKYIRKKDEKLAYGLAQKGYSEKILTVAEKNQAAINHFIRSYTPNGIISVYEKYPKPVQDLIIPYYASEKAFAEQWMKNGLCTKNENPQLSLVHELCMVSENGERVRSKSEKILADKFKTKGIPYIYEMPLKLKGAGFVHPDFFLLNKRTRKEYYWEHFGMMDNIEYCSDAIRKMECYAANDFYPGDNLILTFESSQHPLNIMMVEKLINKFLT